MNIRYSGANQVYIKEGCARIAAAYARPFRVPVLVLYILIAGFVHAGEVDRLIVAVNGKVITEGDLDLARGVKAILFSDKDAELKSRDEEINRLVDLELMQQELQNFSMTREDESRVKVRLQSLRNSYADKGGLPLLLKQLGLQESELVAYLQLESSIMTFVDFRFRPFANVSDEEIKTYYETRLTLQLQKAKLDLPPLAQISGRIEEILKEEKINAVLEQWIKEIRKVSRIEYFYENEEPKTTQLESSKRPSPENRRRGEYGISP